MSKQKKQMVREIKETFSAYEFESSNLKDLKEKVDALIAKYGESAKLNYDKNYYHPYDSEATPSYEVIVSREETDEEFNKRVNEENQWKAKKEDDERKQYEALKKKFG